MQQLEIRLDLSGSMTAGIVSQRGRLLQAGDTAFQIPDIIQTDAVVNPGNSGGALTKHVRTCSWNEYCDTV